MQKIIVERNAHRLSGQVNYHLAHGFKLIAGSTYIVTLETDITLAGAETLGDVKHVFSVGVVGEKERFIMADSLENFLRETNKQLEHDYVIVGSIYFAANRLIGYKDIQRSYANYHACCVYKE